MSNIRVRLKPQKGVKWGLHTTYLFDPDVITEYTNLAKDWAIKATGKVNEEGVDIDYSAKAYAIGGEGTETNNAKYYSQQSGLSAEAAEQSATESAGSASESAESADDSKQWAIGEPTEPAGHSAKYWAEQASQREVQSDWAEVDTTAKSYIKNKPSIPTKTSDLNNDSGFITKDVNNLTNYTTTTDLNSLLSGKQDIANLSQTLDTSTTKYPSNNAVKTAIDAKDSLPSQAGNSGKFLTTDGTTASWADVGGGLEIGDIGFAPLGIDETQNKRRYLNGQVISQAQFVSFTNKVKAAVQLTPSLATSETNWQAEVTNSKLGQCGKFVIDDTLGTIRLPKVVNINGLQDLSLMGSIKAESLPNIEGTFNGGLGSYTPTGAFKKIGTWGDKYAVVSQDCSLFEFDASLSSSTYQDNAPVQQEAVQYPYFIQVATGVEESVDITREIELNNPFSLLDYKWSEYEITNASWLLSSGQFNSGATYNSVYNLLLEIYNGTVTKDGVSVKLSTEAYTDTDFVLNTADTTFRLPIKVKLASGNAVVGNGMTLGLDNGTSLTGLTAEAVSNFGVRLSSQVNAYGVPINNTGTGTNEGRFEDNSRVGITTDATKSGIETSSSGLKLYFYVGETIQDANVIAASQLLTEVAKKTDSVQAAAASMPSSQYIDLTLGALGTIYTAPANGYVQLSATQATQVDLHNVTTGVRNGYAVQTENTYRFTFIPVKKGDSFMAWYSITVLDCFRFIYAEGEN